MSCDAVCFLGHTWLVRCLNLECHKALTRWKPPNYTAESTGHLLSKSVLACRMWATALLQSSAATQRLLSNDCPHLDAPRSTRLGSSYLCSQICRWHANQHVLYLSSPPISSQNVKFASSTAQYSSLAKCMLEAPPVRLPATTNLAEWFSKLNRGKMRAPRLLLGRCRPAGSKSAACCSITFTLCSGLCATETNNIPP